MNLVGSRFFEGHLRKGFVSFVRSRRELRLETWEKGIAPEFFIESCVSMFPFGIAVTDRM